MANKVKNQVILAKHANDLLNFCQKRFGYDRDPTVTFVTDKENYHKLFGKTAYYDPEKEDIVVYIHGRHPKDILRSLAHEIVHHYQNCRGELFSQETLGPGYAQKDCHLRNMEREAYEEGNLAFRDYEDILKTKYKGDTIMIESKLKSAIKNLIKQKLNEGKMPAAAIAGLKRHNAKKGETSKGEETTDEGKCGTHEGEEDKVNEAEAVYPKRIKGKGCCADCNDPKARHEGDEVKEELEESKIITPEQEESFHNRLFGTRLVALNAKLMSNFIKK
tara:strand:- start:52951 stop:53778 length:828 start_codon:yes stop_codon:yes gene_type:complete